VSKLEMPIKYLKVWTRGSIAWFAMELDYIRYVGSDPSKLPITLKLRETGVLEKRNGQWILVAWHESSRKGSFTSDIHGQRTINSSQTSLRQKTRLSHQTDLSGKWFIEEEDRSYTANLDEKGNGPYTHQGGQYTAVQFKDRKLLGTWSQTGNDREGGFEVLFSEDGQEARGIWWYTRVNTNNNIPPREQGGTFIWKRHAPHDAENQDDTPNEKKMMSR